MLDRLIPPSLRERLRVLAARVPALDKAPPAPSILPGLDTQPAPMVPLRPPAAINDNPMQAIEEAVERELRARGHLR